MKRKRRETAGRRPAVGERGGAAGTEAEGVRLQVLEVAHGGFSAITPLNPAFLPGVDRLKLTLRIPGAPDPPRAADLVGVLTDFLPSLSLHRCCGDNSVAESFFDRGERPNCAVNESDPGVDLAHLVEHVIIDVLHFIGRMRACSGVTCARRSPRDVYDIFVECPEEAVGRASAGIALDLVVDLVEGRRPDPRYLCQAQVARAARDAEGLPLRPRLAPLEREWGASRVAEAVEALRRRGFLREFPVSINFSGVPVLAYSPAAAPDESAP